ncbi:MAG: IS256 family transposase [bacterium]
MDYNQRPYEKQGVNIGIGLKARAEIMNTAHMRTELRQGLLDLCIRPGFATLAKMKDEEIEAICGSNWYVHGSGRGAYRWGRTGGKVVLGGRKLAVVRQRRRDLAGHEVLPAVYQHFRDGDQLSRRVMSQLLAGVGSRRYRDSLETGDLGWDFPGGSRSAISRCFVGRTWRVIKAWLSRSLDKVLFVALFIDGINFGAHTLVVALSVVEDGTKQILGVWEGSTENKVVCQALLDNLISRGFPADRPIFVAIDGSKALRQVVVQTFGEQALIQRCQFHKRQNVNRHLPKQLHKLVDQTMMQAYQSADGDRARPILRGLIKTLANSHLGAVRSLEEGLDETLTVVDLNLPKALRQSLQTTNLTESPFSVVRQVARNFKRWRSIGMAEPWVALGLMEAEKRHKIKGYCDIPIFVAVLKKKMALDKQTVVKYNIS